jgi:hypothetical protein
LSEHGAEEEEAVVVEHSQLSEQGAEEEEGAAAVGVVDEGETEVLVERVEEEVEQLFDVEAVFVELVVVVGEAEGLEEVD